MWQNIIDHFQTLENRPVERLVLLVCGMLLLWVIEGAIPMLSLSYRKNKWRHATVNFSFTLIHLLIHTGFAVFIVLLSDYCAQEGIGLVHWLSAGIVWTIIISFLVLDFFGGWLVHMVEHKFPLLWRFHVVHHSDNNVDVTTGLRHHPVESVLRGLFFVAGVMVAGAQLITSVVANVIAAWIYRDPATSATPVAD